MLGYILRRLLATLPVMLIVAVFVFLMLRLTPGDPAAVIAGDNANSEQVAAQNIAEPDEELREDGLVEAEAVADRGDLLGVRVVAGDHRGRIAGREPQHQKHEHRDDQHHR